MSLGSLGLSVIGSTIFVFCLVRAQSLSSGLGNLEARVAAIETGKSSAGGRVASTSTARKLSEDVLLLKSQLADLKADLAKIQSAAGGDGPTLADLTRALDEAIERIEKRQRVEGAVADGRRCQEHNSRISEQLVRGLALTDQQKAAIEAILDAQVEAYRDCWINTERGAQTDRFKSINDETMGKIRETLTEAQKQAFEGASLKWFAP